MLLRKLFILLLPGILWGGITSSFLLLYLQANVLTQVADINSGHQLLCYEMPMKNKVQPTQKEITMREDDFIVSKTDLKGRLTYANKIFVEFSGFTQTEILNKQHNIVRHPDMPRAIFHLLWSTIQAGKEFNGYVKNMSKDGSFYWVFANVTPSYDNNKNIIGYYSVRRKASQQALSVIEPLYQEMLTAEANAGTKNAIEASTSILMAKAEQQGDGYDQFVLSL